MAELEHWRDIKGYVGLYEISDKGRVASFSRKYAHKETIILVPNISDRGYALVTLCKNGKTKHFQVHRLVAEAFIDNPGNKPQVNHIDGNPLNNCKENLEWVTAQENIKHKYDVLKYTSPTRKAVRCVETDTVYESISAAADENSLSVGSLSSVLKGGYGRKTLGGYHWEYVDEPEVIYPSNDNELVIHFEDTNECQDFYNKLLAWKRLRDKHSKFYDSLGNFNEEWNDYDEPKSLEEVEQDVRKLKAWKRLRGKGFKFDGWIIDDGLKISICTNANSDGIYDDDKKETKKDLDICFGGEE